MPKPKAKPNRVNTSDPHLDEAVRQFLGVGPESYAPRDWVSLREQCRLQVLYPGQVVAYRDHYRGRDKARRLVHCEVLCADPRGAVVSKYLARLSNEELYGVFMTHIPGPDELPTVL
jgi:hypothetical protein